PLKAVPPSSGKSYEGGDSQWLQKSRADSIRNVLQIPRPVDVAIHLNYATLVIHLRPAIPIGCLYDGCWGLAWKQYNRLVLACEQHSNRPHREFGFGYCAGPVVHGAITSDRLEYFYVLGPAL